MFNNFLKNKEYSGLFFDENKLQVIKIEEKNNIFFPVYWNSLDFNIENFKEKSEMINFFKRIQSNLKTKKINIEIFPQDEKKTKEIISNLKISGFEKIQFINWDFNIENLIIDKKNQEKTIFIFVDKKNEFNLFYWNQNHIYKKEKMDLNEISKNISKISESLEQKHIFISGYFKEHFNEIKNIFENENIKIHILNLWTNISSLEKIVPALFKTKSHEYIKTIAITLPPLEEVPFKELILDENKEKNKKEIKKEVETKETIDLDFIKDNKKEPIIIEEKFSLWQKIKDFFNKIIFGPENAKSFKLHNLDKIKEKKIFLPKPKIKKKKTEQKENKKKKKEEKKKATKQIKKKKEKKVKTKNKITFLKKTKKIIFLPKNKKDKKILF